MPSHKKKQPARGGDAKRPAGRRKQLGGLAAIVLAAGKGTRMRSARAKVLHELVGRPLVVYPLELARAVGADPVVAVLGHQREAVEAVLLARFGAGTVTVVEQTEQRGTGHAVRLAMPALAARSRRMTGSCWCSTATCRCCAGRRWRRSSAPRAATAASRWSRRRRPIPPATAGSCATSAGTSSASSSRRTPRPKRPRSARSTPASTARPADFFRQATAALRARNAQGEYYLTDIVSRAAASIGVSAIEADFRDVAGINDRQQLAEAEAVMRERIIRGRQAHVTFRDPSSVVVEPDVELGVDVEIGRNVALRGRTRVDHGARIGDGVILTNTEVGAGAELKPYTVATDSSIGPRATVGPFAHLRPGTRLAAESHVGNFVEIKKTVLGKGSKANHLSYLGDATIGEKVNVGAGTITCNYNGYEKFQTVIEDGAFIGSDTQLIAPVRIGRARSSPPGRR